MNTQKKIAVLDATYPLLPFYKQAYELGYKIYSFDRDPDSPCKKYVHHFYPVSYQNIDEVVRICKENGVKGVISFSAETALPYVNAVARELKSPGNSIECEMFMQNKYTMRERLKECGVSIPEYQIVHNYNIVEDFEYPVIVKPTDNGGSRGITKVENKECLLPAIEWAMKFARNGQVLIEKFIEGREFSVEYISHKGKHYFVAITDKVTTGSPHFVELEHHQPANITSEIAAEIKKLTEDTLDALKVYSSTSHTEIKMDVSGELYLIETGARMGGDFITSDLVKLSTGYDFVKGAIDLAIDEFTEPAFGNSNFSGIYFLTKGREYISHYIENINKYNFIVNAQKYGTPIIEVKQNNDRAGHFIYQNKTEKITITS